LLRSRPPGAELGGLALALGLALFAGCATTWDASIPPRTVRLVLAVDDAFRFHARWQDDLADAVRGASGVFERKAGIRFETLRVVSWAAPTPVGDGRALDHLLNTIPAADADVIVGVSGGCDHTHAGSARLFSRVALATTGCTPFLQKRTPTLEQLLTHELAHLFGAFHPAPGVRSTMRGADADVWDSQTLRVVRLMRNFDFVRGVDGVDEATREAYTRIYAEGHDPGDANGIAVARETTGGVSPTPAGRRRRGPGSSRRSRSIPAGTSRTRISGSGTRERSSPRRRRRSSGRPPSGHATTSRACV